ncbi:hypothetical protein ACSFA8_26500 [Variovorax sp. RT4R15]|uniref:hypothetical protein n=1 Tax=Variovorax sp. RT4R15 TaxID=3443737 RepID=UPI003F480D7E
MAYALAQVFVIGGRASAFGEPKETAHAMLHWQGLAHHHHDDGSIGQDSSEDSIQHVAVDGFLSASAVGFVAPLSLPPGEAIRPIVTDELDAPWPDLAGPRRPPRLTT